MKKTVRVLCACIPIAIVAVGVIVFAAGAVFRLIGFTPWRGGGMFSIVAFMAAGGAFIASGIMLHDARLAHEERVAKGESDSLY